MYLGDHMSAAAEPGLDMERTQESYLTCVEMPCIVIDDAWLPAFLARSINHFG
jgi:hypothetical protein